MGKALQSFADWRVQENLIEYNFYYKKFQRLLMSMFTWCKLPDGISSRFIEDKLFSNGMLIFFKSEMGFYVVAQATPIGLNDYEEPIGYNAWGINKIHEYVKARDCVVIWNDIFRDSSVGSVNFFAKRLSNVIKTIDVNLEQLKNPNLVVCPENLKESAKSVMEDRTNGVPYIYVSDKFKDLVQVESLDMHIKDNTSSLSNLKKEIENDALTHFGVNNVNVLKKERLVTGEADQNNEQIELNRFSFYGVRKKAVDEINSKFGLNIELCLSLDIVNQLKTLLGGEDND